MGGLPPKSARLGARHLWIVLGVTAFLLVAWLGALQQPLADERERDEIERLIRRYNELLALGYREMDMSGMREVATQLQAEDEYIFMSSMAEGGVRLEATLQDLEFLVVDIEESSAQVETRETWDYLHYNRNDGSQVLRQDDLIYHLAWDLEKQTDGGWLVSDVRAISSTSTVEPSVTGTITPGHGR